jgi:hypothetical protein
VQIALNRSDTLKKLEEATSTIVFNMAYSQFCASIYTALQEKVDQDDALSKLKAEMDTALPRFYAAVLIFSVKARLYLHSAGLGELLGG